MSRERIARFQSDLYRDQYRFSVRLLLFLSSLSIVLVGAISWQIFIKKVPQTYYASVADGEIVPMKQEPAGV